MRSYYNEIPLILQTDEHTFMDVSLCKLFSEAMQLLWASASNIAAFYNVALGFARYDRAPGWSYNLSADKINHAFQLHALILDHCESGQILSVLNIGSAEERLQALVRERNTRMKIFGDRAARDHICDVCCIRVPGSGTNGLGMLHIICSFS